MANPILKAVIVVLAIIPMTTLIVCSLFAICKASDELERIADALEKRQGDDESEGGAE